MQKPLILIDGRFALAEFAFFREEGVVLQGMTVGQDSQAFEIILGDKALKLVDLARTSAAVVEAEAASDA